MRDFLETYYAEILGVVALVCLFALLHCYHIPVTGTILALYSSLGAQVMATYVGLILTAYAILYALDLEVKTLTHLKDETNIRIAKDELDGLHRTFIQAIYLTAIGTIIFLAVFFISSVSDSSGAFESAHAYSINSLIAALLFGLLTCGTLNIVGAVRTLLSLRSLKF